MCTSNLENLDFDSVIKNDKASHSLLGDVLLSAKMDAQKIKDLYQQQNGKSELTDPNYQETVCRAIRYSFADLGDIIKGTDLWEANPGEKIHNVDWNSFW
ncbi:hypothetical protein PFHG_05345 [Plasmodium falciparum HB3]|uniref:Duffy-antigen binding domain-containing protein n=1 Tax=Plasmodium falciparum (isolate HB3) TaxID=137071 RepID=A0A0L7KL49_PLAFX|nr:hypothetical protein PFHG_05345 [Plasmodium falciparum HB3]